MWTDSDGFNCEAYGQTTHDKMGGVSAWCQMYGDAYANFGHTANQACCVCGGGSPPTAPLVTPPTAPLVTSDCEVTVYEHWPDGMTPSIPEIIEVYEHDPDKPKVNEAWGVNNDEYLPTGEKQVIHGTGKHSLNAALQNITSSLKVKGHCCRAYGFIDKDCGGTHSGGSVASNDEFIVGHPGVLAGRLQLSFVWHCHDCVQCVEVTQICND
jgi:hypothetical protein